MNSQPPVVSANGGGAGDRNRGGPRGGRSRRAKNRRYRLNRQIRSRLLVISWNAEGLRKKIPEVSRWLSEKKVDVLAVQEVQLSAGKTISIPGFQTAAIARRAQGRRQGGPVKGGDVAIFVRSGLSYDPIDTSPLLPQDTTTEWCAVRVFLQQQQQQQQLQQQQPRQQPQQQQQQGQRQQQQQRARQYSHRSTHSYIDVFNIYRPPIRTSQQDERVDHFSMRFFPTGGNTLIVGDVNAHHPSWDDNRQMPDSVGDHIYAWELTNSWVTLNSGEPQSEGVAQVGPIS